MSKEQKKHDEEEYVDVKVKKSTIKYEKDLENLQIELLKFQNHVKAQGLKILIILEGRDGAGKGGSIKRLTEHLNPRGCRTVALGKPNSEEQTQWYFQRYVNHLPSAGEIVIFDRSWYNRAGVEYVMGFCTPEQHEQFLREVPLFEHMIHKSGVMFFKIYLSVSKKQQQKRFKERLKNPLKQYKLSPVDQKSQELWGKYTIAKYSMLLASNTEACPWTIIDSNDKKKARLNLIRFILSKVEYPGKKEGKFSKIDTDLVRSGEEEIFKMEAEAGQNKDIENAENGGYEEEVDGVTNATTPSQD